MLRKIVILVVCLLCACEKPPVSNDLVGRWQYIDDRLMTKMIYHSNYTFETEVTVNGEYLGRASGIWKMTDDTIDYVYTASGLERIPVGTRDRDIVVSVADGKLVLHNAADDNVLYLKISAE